MQPWDLTEAGDYKRRIRREVRRSRPREPEPDRRVDAVSDVVCNICQTHATVAAVQNRSYRRLIAAKLPAAGPKYR